MDEIAQQESIELPITLDGAELTKDFCHLSFGVKITDPHAIEPRDGTPLVYMKEGVLGNIFRVQSRNFCLIMKTLLGKGSKAAYHEFTDIFKFFENLMKDGLPANDFGPRIMPVMVWSPQDLSSIWKSLNTGGGARKAGTKHWCYLCACTGNKIASFVVGNNRCRWCIEKNHEKCYHWAMGDENLVMQFQEEQMAQYRQVCGRHFWEVKVESEVLYNPGEINRFGNKYNIDFEPAHEGNEEADILFFTSLVSRELRHHKLSLSGNLSEQ